MTNDDTSLERLENTAVMDKSQYDAVMADIRAKMREIHEKYSETPKKHKYSRKGGDGKLFDYIRKAYLMGILNEHFPNWNYIHPHQAGQIGGILVYVHGGLILDFNGIRRIFHAMGDYKIKFLKDGRVDGNPMMAADTNAFKKCCYLALQIARDVYEKLEIEREITDSDLERITEIVQWIPQVLDDEDGKISVANRENLANAYEYFNDILSLPDSVGRENLIAGFEKFDKLKEAVDAERTRD